MRIDLIRHGPTETSGLLLGRTDASPAATAYPQLVQQTAGRTWSAVVASPLARARVPAEALANERDLPLRTDANWRELDFGDWDGQPLTTLRADPSIAAGLDALYADTGAPPPPNGESWRDLETRTGRALAALLDAALLEPGADEGVLVVTHGGPMRAALSLACGFPFSSTWAFRIDYGTRIALRIERTNSRALWGEILEIAQP